MKTNNILLLATAVALTFASSGAFAVATIGAGTNSGAANTTVTIPVTYTRPVGDPFNVFSATFRFAHTNPPITFVSFAAGAGPTSSATTCNGNMANTLVTCVLTTNPPTAIAVGNYTLGTITYQIAAGAAPGAQSLVTTVVECTDINGDAIVGSCNSANGTITVTGGVVNTPPVIAYSSPVNGGTVTYSAGGVAPANIVATPSGGAGAGAPATTTVGACTLAGGGAAFMAGFPIAQLSFIGPTVAAQNIVLPNCTPQAVAVNATLTCPELRNGVAVNPAPSFTLSCPAAAPVAVAPVIAFTNPAIGGTVTYSAGGVAPANITATPSGGSGVGAPATTTVGACTLAGGGAAFAAGFPIAQLSFIGPTVTAQNIVLPNCTPQAAAVNATLSCPTVRGGVAVNPVPSFTLTCPAAGPAGVAPVLTYNPAPNSSTPILAGQTAVIAVGCPTEGANCTGSGAGPSATSTLSNLTAVYNGPMFSPTPGMVCQFVTQAGAPAGNLLSFVALQADAGNISCVCPANTTNLPTEPFIVSVEERTPSTAGPVARSFTIVCGGPPPPGCPTIAAAPGAGTVTLINNGGTTLVTTATLTGAVVGQTQTVSCAVTGASVGSTFTITTAPTPLTLSSVVTSGTVLAACTNSAQTLGTATLTCTSTSSQLGCATLNTQYTLNCPGVPVVPPITFIPVPAMSEQGRILLAALMLLLGLGVVGFRMRG